MNKKREGPRRDSVAPLLSSRCRRIIPFFSFLRDRRHCSPPLGWYRQGGEELEMAPLPQCGGGGESLFAPLLPSSPICPPSTIFCVEEEQQGGGALFLFHFVVAKQKILQEIHGGQPVPARIYKTDTCM